MTLQQSQPLTGPEGKKLIQYSIPDWIMLSIEQRPEKPTSNLSPLSDKDGCNQRQSLDHEFARRMYNFHPSHLVDYLIHPLDEFYYERQNLDESIASCLIIEGLTAYSATARSIYSKSLQHYLCKFLYLCKYLFLGKPMNVKQTIMVFRGVQATLLALSCLATALMDHGNLCEDYIEIAKQTEMVTSALFFLKLLGESNHTDMPPPVIYLQKHVGLASLNCFTNHALLINHRKALQSKVANIEDLFTVAHTVVHVSERMNRIR